VNAGGHVNDAVNWFIKITASMVLLMGVAAAPVILLAPGSKNVESPDVKGWITVFILVATAVPTAIYSLKYANAASFHSVHRRAIVVYVVATLTWTASLVALLSIYDYRYGLVVNEENGIRMTVFFVLSIIGICSGYVIAVIALLCAALVGHSRNR